jgi:hypothetical protein
MVLCIAWLLDTVDSHRLVPPPAGERQAALPNQCGWIQPVSVKRSLSSDVAGWTVVTYDYNNKTYENKLKTHYIDIINNHTASSPSFFCWVDLTIDTFK